MQAIKQEKIHEAMIKEISLTILWGGKFCQFSLDYIIYDTKVEKCYLTVRKVGRSFLRLGILYILTAVNFPTFLS